jgi:hypothetical protein
LANFSSSSVVSADQPNESLDLDPSFKDLLQDVDISLLKQKNNVRSLDLSSPSHPVPRELEALLVEAAEELSREPLSGFSEDIPADEEDYHAGPREARKSPAALFGSQSIGQVVLPFDLQKAITKLIAGKESFRLFTCFELNFFFLSRIGQNNASQ